MKQATNFAGKLLAVCLALVLAASMLAVPAWAGDGNNTGAGDSSTTPPASSDDGGSSGITGGTPYITGYTVAAAGRGGRAAAHSARAEVLHHRKHLRPALYQNTGG
ncbi:MAG: hypothetical protein ACLRPX_04800 [Ruthenibacterium sp.]